MRILEHILYRISHSWMILGGTAAVILICAVFVSLDYRDTTMSSTIPCDPRISIWSALAIAGAVLVYDNENRIPTAVSSRGNSRIVYFLVRMVICCILTLIAYICAAIGVARLAKGSIDSEFFNAALIGLLPVIATACMIVLLATLFRGMTAYLAVAVLLVFAVWNGLGADIGLVRCFFPPYMQMDREVNTAEYVICATWIVCITLLGSAVISKANLE